MTSCIMWSVVVRSLWGGLECWRMLKCIKLRQIWRIFFLMCLLLKKMLRSLKWRPLINQSGCLNMTIIGLSCACSLANTIIKEGKPILSAWNSHSLKALEFWWWWCK
jgi:hypothetical protein